MHSLTLKDVEKVKDTFRMDFRSLGCSHEEAMLTFHVFLISCERYWLREEILDFVHMLKIALEIN